MNSHLHQSYKEPGCSCRYCEPIIPNWLAIGCKVVLKSNGSIFRVISVDKDRASFEAELASPQALMGKMGGYIHNDGYDKWAPFKEPCQKCKESHET